VQRAAPVDAIELARRFQRAHGVEPREGAYVGFHLMDCVDEGMRDRLARHVARGDHARELRGGQAVQRGFHRRILHAESTAGRAARGPRGQRKCGGNRGLDVLKPR